MRSALLLVMLMGVVGCESAPDTPESHSVQSVETKPKEPEIYRCECVWKGPFNTSLGPEWRFIKNSDGRFMAEVTKDDDYSYHVWHNGAGYGQYETLAQAKTQAEKLVSELGDGR